ncbi:hypothetical protein G210_1166 [Candida maltosa Xu316]|uniref:Uncharacterized protein n=1 Tax=Candida maltosa (strain Xu316) TaxID=1245528 RepID=M3IPC0_CANMX|nr:hypothetical protein G210_1166 [Candida maltosa Xu316]
MAIAPDVVLFADRLELFPEGSGVAAEYGSNVDLETTGPTWRSPSSARGTT